MNLKSLRVFVNIMEEGTLAQACRKLNLSQPAASRLIQILEAEFDIQLFNREKKRLIPTQEGEAFYPEALRILASIDDLPGMFEQIAKDAAPPLRVICHPRLVEGLIVPAMAELVRRDPSVKVKLEVHPRRYLGRRILHGLFDVGIATLPLPDRNPTPRFLARTDMLVALPAAHPLAAREVLTPADVAGLSYVALEDTTNMRSLLDRELAKADQHLEVTHEMSTSLAACRLVKAGIGFTFTDAITVSPDDERGIAIRQWRPRVQIELGYFVSETNRPHRARDAFLGILNEVCESRSGADLT
ncbi:LysR family transcriptional regulator [Jannaschia pohangensis]|uniref:Transcriptional regulator, LysR family n=1 Tax=Jannaschia pohangensis TaxID=390807 RepID=A0A1I3GPQ2_9RHOB|nr:LysR family transcriptional regulator [Jannaschia pohangensis]SFI25396.1 transcriptional regulator, LysR family [Jannaschia pohangensis]